MDRYSDRLFAYCTDGRIYEFSVSSTNDDCVDVLLNAGNAGLNDARVGSARLTSGVVISYARLESRDVDSFKIKKKSFLKKSSKSF